MSNTKTDCLFIQPPFSAQGILPHSDSHTAGEGLLSIASFLDSKGFTTEIFCVDELYLDLKNFTFNRDKHEYHQSSIIKRIRKANPKIVGVSALTPQYPAALEILELCKKVNPEIVTVIGGPHATFTNEKVFADSGAVDIVVRGEGEWTMLDVAEHITANKPLDKVAGITYKCNDKVMCNSDRPMGDLSQLPPVDHSKVNPEYMKKCRYFLTFTRGCPFNCSYCVEGKYWGRNVRTRSVQAVVSEVKYLMEEYDNDILFLGSVFNAPEDFFREICSQIKDLDFGTRDICVLVGAAHLPEEHIRLMKEAGIKKLLIAVESAAPEILKRMNKRITFELVVEKCRLIRKYGLEIGTFWIFGHPGETEETARKSLDAMVYMWENDLNDKQEIATFVPYPGLPITQNPEKEGYKILETDLTRHSRFDKPLIDLTTIPYDKMCEIYKEAREVAQYWASSRREIFDDDLLHTLQNVLIKK